MDLRSLEIFCAVYSEHSYTNAARKLAMTQSAVSQQIKKLETMLEVELFDPHLRTTPTAAGDTLFREAGRLLAEFHDLKNELKNIRGLGQGKISYGMIDVVAIELLPNVLPRFRREHPHVQVDAAVKTSHELVRMVEQHELDFALVVAGDFPETLLSHRIYRDSFVALMKKDSPLCKKNKLMLRDLREQDLILYPAHSQSRLLVDRAFARHGIFPRVVMEMHYPAAMVSLVQQGMGVAILSKLSAERDCLPGQAILEIKELCEARQLVLIEHRQRNLSPQAKALMELILRSARDGKLLP